MNLTPPFIAQERPDTCALACLRMVLAREDKHFTEAELLEMIENHEGGLTPAELSGLARHFGLLASEEQVDTSGMLNLIEKNACPITFIFREPIDKEQMTHAVIPLRHSTFCYIFGSPTRRTAHYATEIRKGAPPRGRVGSYLQDLIVM